MFFVGLTFTLILLLSGVALLIESSYLIGSILLGVGIVLLILLVRYYRRRNRKKEEDGLDCLDCNAGALNCPDFSSKKKMDCDGDKGLGCDCSPNCSTP
ncbi:hypothetical protein [Bacillus sp. Marseille-P3661]|uniref:hypothetical protein n=1 Tax=Bacillus sp. Marseille-P3661 TaxID=1936234 RepID=UPI000C8634F3|nr:hypothetical protein [Bacillus sp. Marseille-P3661]